MNCFKNRMKLVSVIALCALTGTAVADRKEDLLQIQFRQMAEDCQRAIDGAAGYELPANSKATLSDCYQQKVRVSFNQAKLHHDLRGRFEGSYLIMPRMAYGADRSKMLRAALKAEPSLAVAAYDGALRGRVSPVLAYTIASAALPSAQQSFAQRAIAYGADPSQVAEATAAGIR